MGRPQKHFTRESKLKAQRASAKRWRQSHPDSYAKHIRATNNWKKYGLTEAQWVELWSHGCGICGTHEQLVIDHDHKTGKVRGALCSTHNTALGKFGDDPEQLRVAIKWLERS